MSLQNDCDIESESSQKDISENDGYSSDETLYEGDLYMPLERPTSNSIKRASLETVELTLDTPDTFHSTPSFQTPPSPSVQVVPLPLRLFGRHLKIRLPTKELLTYLKKFLHFANMTCNVQRKEGKTEKIERKYTRGCCKDKSASTRQSLLVTYGTLNFEQYEQLIN
ncbi:hypothetical protein CR513_13596, partial [Mucuna pruriens]